jgi:ABC-type bacteriocin/lantibiotic exporter with double-glycine peptidase domain
LKISSLDSISTLFFTSTIFLPSTAVAYVGPGAGLSAIGSLLALIAAVLLAIVGFLWYPLKRIMKKRKTKMMEDNKQ